MVNVPFDRGHKVENIPLFALPLVTNSSDLLETWPRCIETAEREYSATRHRKPSINVFSSEARQ